ncbi:MAG TPA: hypothetical protein VFG10_07085 [Saprospiraceae bacterium]|nr:hypothetical protein [Saprospiraceae bacterium]
MGITIFYSGRLRSMELLPSRIKDVVHQCTQMKWGYEKILPSFEIPVEGIAFEPTGSQAIWMTFLENRQLVSPEDYLFSRHVGQRIKRDHLMETKTHFAGATIHMQIIPYVRHLSDTYFSAFRLVDESQYWETNDRSLCESEFRWMEKWVYQMISRLDALDGRVGEIGRSGEIMDERIMDLLRRMDPMDVVENLHTPPPKKETVEFFWN